MDDVQQETPEAPVEMGRPEPCAGFLVGGLAVTLVGLGILVYGIYTFLQFDGTLGNVGAVVLGSIVTVTGTSVLLTGVFRAGDALDYLVQTR